MWDLYFALLLYSPLWVWCSWFLQFFLSVFKLLGSSSHFYTPVWKLRSCCRCCQWTGMRCIGITLRVREDGIPRQIFGWAGYGKAQWDSERNNWRRECNIGSERHLGAGGFCGGWMGLESYDPCLMRHLWLNRKKMRWWVWKCPWLCCKTISS